MRDLNIALVQQATVWHDARANRELYGTRILDLAGRADLIVLPETFLSGFSNEAIANAEGMDGASVRWLSGLARETGATITGSLVMRTDELAVNRLLWARPDGSIEHYDKRHLFRMAGEHQRYAGGRERLLVELHGWRICPLVCYDLRFPVYIRNRFDAAAQRLDYDLLLFVANWPSPRRHAWRTLLRARAIENLCYCVGVNRVGIDGNQLHYAGDSVALDFLGEAIVELGSEPGVITATLSAERLVAHRERFPAWLDADEFELRL
ncbi:MAG: amidohydrolase [Xanthomonadales bacterium PRO6]|nr:Omega-amidase YafV [Xanthomonadales bacterium]MCE7932149.1 amidohydrolase [Xanthomonadales bacterium PRO6]